MFDSEILEAVRLAAEEPEQPLVFPTSPFTTLRVHVSK